MKVGEGEEGLGVVHGDHHLLSDIVLTVGGAYEAPDLDDKRTINNGTKLPLKFYERGEGSIKPKRHVFILKVGTGERIMDFFKSYTG